METECELASDTPTKFVAIVMRPEGEATQAMDMGKVMGTLMSDQIFAGVAYSAAKKEDLVNELNNHTKEMTVLAPSTWDPSIRLDPPKSVPTVTKRMESYHRQNTNGSAFNQAAILNSLEEGKGTDTSGDEKQGPYEDIKTIEEQEDLTLVWTGRPFRGLIADVKRKLPW